MRMVATKAIELGGVIHTPGTEFDAEESEAKKLVRASKAERKDGVVDPDFAPQHSEKP